MRLRKSPRPLTSEEIRERNIARVMNPRKRRLWDRIMGIAWEVEEWWCRHVTQRELYRQLDNMLIVGRQDRPDPAAVLRRLRTDFLNPGRDHQGSDDDRS
jgi:hypothetical protein